MCRPQAIARPWPIPIGFALSILLGCSAIEPDNPFDPEAPATIRATGNLAGRIAFIREGPPLPLTSATVELRSDSAEEAADRTVSADETGRFRLADVRDGVWYLRAAAPGFVEEVRRVELGIGETFDLGLLALRDGSGGALGGTLRASVLLKGRAEHGGTRVVVRLAGESRLYGSAVTDASGLAEVPAAVDGRYTLGVERPGWAYLGDPDVYVWHGGEGALVDAYGAVTGHFGPEGDPSAPIELELDPTRDATLAVTFRTSPAWLPELERWSRVRLSGPVLRTVDRVDAGLPHEFTELPLGSYVVTLERAGFETVSLPVELVESGARVTLEVPEDLRLVDLGAARIGLAGMALDACDLRGLRLRGADLDGTFLAGDFSADGCAACALPADTPCEALVLDGAQLADARIAPGSRFDGASLVGATLSSVRAVGVDFSGADLSLANFSAAELGCAVDAVEGKTTADACDGEACESATTFASANLRGVVFNGANLRGVVFSEAKSVVAALGLAPCNAFTADLLATIVNLAGTSFTNADLSFSNLAGADLSEAQVAGATLRNTCLASTCLRQAPLSLIDLTGADLDRADAEDAFFTSSLMSGVTARGARLDGANLVGAILERVDFRPVPDCEPLPWRDDAGGDPEACRGDDAFEGARCCRTSAREVALNGALLIGARLDGSDLSGAEFQGAVFSTAPVLPDEKPDNCDPQYYQACVAALSAVFDCPGTIGGDFGADRNIIRSFCEFESLGQRSPIVGGYDIDCVNRVAAAEGCHAVECTTDAGESTTVQSLDVCSTFFSFDGVDCSVQRGPAPTFCQWDDIVEGTCEGDVPGVCLESPNTASDTRFAGASMRSLDLRGLEAVGARFDGADLSDTDLSGAALDSASFVDASAPGLVLGGTVIEDVDFRGADLRGMELENSWLIRAGLDGADLSNATLAGAYIEPQTVVGEPPTLASVVFLSGRNGHPTTIVPAGNWEGVVLDGVAESLALYCFEDTPLSSEEQPLQLTNLLMGDAIIAGCDLSFAQISDEKEFPGHVSLIGNVLDSARISIRNGLRSLALRGNRLAGAELVIDRGRSEAPRGSAESEWLTTSENLEHSVFAALTNWGVPFRTAPTKGFSGIIVQENEFESATLRGDAWSGVAFAPLLNASSGSTAKPNRISRSSIQAHGIALGATVMSGGEIFGVVTEGTGRFDGVCFGPREEEDGRFFDVAEASGDWSGVVIDALAGPAAESDCLMTFPGVVSSAQARFDRGRFNGVFVTTHFEFSGGEDRFALGLEGAFSLYETAFDRSDLHLVLDDGDSDRLAGARFRRSYLDALALRNADSLSETSPEGQPHVSFHGTLVDQFDLPTLQVVAEWSCLGRGDTGRTHAPDLRWTRVTGDLTAPPSEDLPQTLGSARFEGVDLRPAGEGVAFVTGDFRGAVFATAGRVPARAPVDRVPGPGPIGNSVEGRIFSFADLRGADLRGICDFERGYWTTAVLGGNRVCRSAAEWLRTEGREDALVDAIIDDGCVPLVCPRLDELCETRRAGCLPDEIPCDDDACIPAGLACDGRRDCSDGADEVGCTCDPAAQYPCAAGGCIAVRGRCDGMVQCGDGSDENECDACSRHEASSYELVICGEKCVPDLYCVDGVPDPRFDCRALGDDLSLDCAQCADGRVVPPQWIGDGRHDCADGSDETRFPRAPGWSRPHWLGSDSYPCDREVIALNPRSDAPGEFPLEANFDGGYAAEERCDGIFDCADHSDEAGCPHPDTRPPCACDEFRCGNGDCIPRYDVCSGYESCPGGEDEVDCPGLLRDLQCCADEFECADGRCIPTRYICDGGPPDCPGGDDEADCARHGCGAGETSCADGTCLSAAFVCDGVPQCRDGDDEVGCVACDPLEPSICGEAGACRVVGDAYACRSTGPVSEFQPCASEACANGLDCFLFGELPDADLLCVAYCDARLGGDGCSGRQGNVCVPQPELGVNVGLCLPDAAVDACNACDLFACDSGRCIRKAWVCDQEDDCGDGSDEADCAVLLAELACCDDEFKCPGGPCVPNAYLCDGGPPDCAGGEDEANCPSP
jgi:uncharacterized protein YjbI with pentapeptide repeats